MYLVSTNKMILAWLLTDSIRRFVDTTNHESKYQWDFQGPPQFFWDPLIYRSLEWPSWLQAPAPTAPSVPARVVNPWAARQSFEMWMILVVVVVVVHDLSSTWVDSSRLNKRWLQHQQQLRLLRLLRRGCKVICTRVKLLDFSFFLKQSCWNRCAIYQLVMVCFEVFFSDFTPIWVRFGFWCWLIWTNE